jgi:hypothetical protein
MSYVCVGHSGAPCAVLTITACVLCRYRLLKDAEAEEEAFYMVQRRRPVEQAQFQKRWKEFQRRRIARRKAGRDNADGKSVLCTRALAW